LKRDYYAHGFIAAVLGLAYGGGMLVFGFLLMKMAWGGISLSEPRFLSAIFLYSIFAYYLMLHRKNRREWTAIYALIGGMLGATAYILAKGNSRQLHPVDVIIPREMIYPLYISFLAFALLYYYAFKSLLTWRTNEKH
jgi:TRAP-type C4-dicarboxylate transport system permease small subunit